MNTTVKQLWHALALVMAVIGLTACATPPSASDKIGEAFVLERDLLGKTIATGSFSAIDGTHREFVIDINGSWDGNALTLVEDFEYDDGVQERKTWVFTKLPSGEFSGVREDVVGTARGYQDGEVFRLEYTMAIPDENGKPGRNLKFQDILYNQPDGIVRNKATVGLWGLRVATVNLTIQR